VPIDGAGFGKGEPESDDFNWGTPRRPAYALPKRGPPDVTRFRSAAAKRVQAHRARARLGLRCLTVRVSDRIVRHLISTGYLSLESGEDAAAVAIALEAWIATMSPERWCGRCGRCGRLRTDVF
jgi:hypothetical protein